MNSHKLLNTGTIRSVELVFGSFREEFCTLLTLVDSGRQDAFAFFAALRRRCGGIRTLHSFSRCAYILVFKNIDVYATTHVGRSFRWGKESGGLLFVAFMASCTPGRLVCVVSVACSIRVDAFWEFRHTLPLYRRRRATCPTLSRQIL